MPFGQLSLEQQVTPYRKTLVTFDEPMNCVTEAPFNFYRAAKDIHPLDTTDLDFLSPGAWSLKPRQHNISTVVEQSGPDNTTLRQANVGTSFVTGVVEKTSWRAPSDLTGATSGASANLASASGYVLRRRPAAGADWSQGVTADAASFPQVPTSSNIPMIRLVVSNLTDTADTGYLVRVFLPAGRLHSSDILHIFYFGGANLPTGGGQFALSIGGDGESYLNCYLPDGSGVYHWYQVARWRYADPTQAGFVNIFIRPYPYLSGRGACIEFRSGVNDSAEPQGGFASGLVQRPAQPRSFTFWLTDLLYAQSGILSKPQQQTMKQGLRSLTHATGAGNVRVDSRQDHRGAIQIATFTYPPSALLTERAFGVPFQPTTTNNLTLAWECNLPAGTSIVGTLYNADDGTPLSIVTSSLTTTSCQFVPVPTASGYYAQFDLVANTGRNFAPNLFGYRVVRDGVITSSGTTEWTGGIVKSIAIAGPESDPSHETATVTIHDPTDVLNKLRIRDEIPMRIETQYDQSDDTLRSVLYRGFTQQAVATKLGNDLKQGIDGSGPASAYPNSFWRHYVIPSTGMWTRLKTALLPTLSNLTDSTGQPAKVTDVVKLLFQYAGMPAALDSVPDAPVRFWPTLGSDTPLLLSPGANIADLIYKFVRDYLGWYIIWDDNAGTVNPANHVPPGMWRVLTPPQPPYTPLASFTEQGPSGKLGHMIASYGANAAPIFAGKWHSWTLAPEGNLVQVVGAADNTSNSKYCSMQWMVNTDSYTFDPAHPASPTNPDFLGYIKLIRIVDGAIQGQQSCNFVCARTFDIACHAIKMAVIEDCPMLLITDPADTLQTRPRKLRYYDPVSVTVDGVTGTYLVRNFNPRYIYDGIQYGRMELQAPIQGAQHSGTFWIR